MNIVTWVLFGLVVGIVANLLDPVSASRGWLGTIAVGILGSLLGGFLGDLIFGVGVTGFNLPSFILAVIGSLLVIFTNRTFVKA